MFNLRPGPVHGSQQAVSFWFQCQCSSSPQNNTTTRSVPTRDVDQKTELSGGSSGGMSLGEISHGRSEDLRNAGIALHHLLLVSPYIFSLPPPCLPVPVCLPICLDIHLERGASCGTVYLSFLFYGYDDMLDSRANEQSTHSQSVRLTTPRLSSPTASSPPSPGPLSSSSAFTTRCTRLRT